MNCVLQIRKLTEDTGQEEKRRDMLETRITVSLHDTIANYIAYKSFL